MRSPIVAFTIAAAVAMGPALVSGIPASPGGPGADLAARTSEVSNHGHPSDNRILQRRDGLTGTLGAITGGDTDNNPGNQEEDPDRHNNIPSEKAAEPNYGEGRDSHGHPTTGSTHGRHHDGTDGNFPDRNPGTGGRSTGPQGSGSGSPQTPGSGSPQNSGGNNVPN